MDILKELFGTSDELQISKSLFGSDAPSTSVELGLGEQGRTERGRCTWFDRCSLCIAVYG